MICFCASMGQRQEVMVLEFWRRLFQFILQTEGCLYEPKRYWNVFLHPQNNCLNFPESTNLFPSSDLEMACYAFFSLETTIKKQTLKGNLAFKKKNPVKVILI